jgi:hypothetical protein
MTITKDPVQFLLAEYAQLKGEILKRSEFQHQLISIALVALGALITVGVKDAPAALLAYPMLALFLSAAWSYNDAQIAQLGIYIRYRIEDQLVGGGLGWENAIPSDCVSKIIGARIRYATRGILWGSEFLAIGLYLLKRLSMTWPTGNAGRLGEVFLLALSITAVAFTVLVMRDKDLRKVIAENMQKPIAK